MFWVMFWTFIIVILAIVLILPWIFIALLPFALLIGSFCLLCVFPIVRRLLRMREDTQILEFDITQKLEEIDNQAILTGHRPLELGTKDQDTNPHSRKKGSNLTYGSRTKY